MPVARWRRRSALASAALGCVATARGEGAASEVVDSVHDAVVVGNPAAAITAALAALTVVAVVVVLAAADAMAPPPAPLYHEASLPLCPWKYQPAQIRAGTAHVNTRREALAQRLLTDVYEYETGKVVCSRRGTEPNTYVSRTGLRW